MIPRVADLTGPIVGRYYMVPCVRRGRKWWPILGPWHADPELNVAVPHYHYDLRFVAVRAMRQLPPATSADMSIYSVDQRALGRVQARFDEGPTLKRLQCRRPTPVFPSAFLEQLGHLETTYATATLCRVCPHRGMPIEAMPIVDGVRVCPGHGLRWDVVTGRLRPVSTQSQHPVNVGER
jgi:hypothetical protein